MDQPRDPAAPSSSAGPSGRSRRAASPAVSWTSAPRRTSARQPLDVRQDAGERSGCASSTRWPVAHRRSATSSTSCRAGTKGHSRQHPVAAAEPDRPQRLASRARAPAPGASSPPVGELDARRPARASSARSASTRAWTSSGSTAYSDEMCGVATSTSRAGALRRPRQRDRPGDVRRTVVEPGEHVAVQVDHAPQATAAASGPLSRTLCPAWTALPTAPAGCARGCTCCCRRCSPRCSPSARAASSRPRPAASAFVLLLRRRRPHHASRRPAVRGLEPGAGRVAPARWGLLAAWTLLSAVWSDAPLRAMIEFDRVLALHADRRADGLVRPAARRPRPGARGRRAPSCAASRRSRSPRALAPDALPISAGAEPSRLAFPFTYWNAAGVGFALGLVLALHVSAGGQPRLVGARARRGRVAGRRRRPLLHVLARRPRRRGARRGALRRAGALAPAGHHAGRDRHPDGDRRGRGLRRRRPRHRRLRRRRERGDADDARRARLRARRGGAAGGGAAARAPAARRARLAPPTRRSILLGASAAVLAAVAVAAVATPLVERDRRPPPRVHRDELHHLHARPARPADAGQRQRADRELAHRPGRVRARAGDGDGRRHLPPRVAARAQRAVQPDGRALALSRDAGRARASRGSCCSPSRCSSRSASRSRGCAARSATPTPRSSPPAACS